MRHCRPPIDDETILATALFSSSGKQQSIQMHQNFLVQKSKAKEPEVPSSSSNTCSQAAAKEQQIEKNSHLIEGFGPPPSVFSSFLLFS
jgi:hypothetical protein